MVADNPLLEGAPVAAENRRVGVWLSVGATLAILVVLYLRVDLGSMLGGLRGIHGRTFAFAMLCFIPILALDAERLRVIFDCRSRISFLRMGHLVLASWALNGVTPSRMGEFSLAYFLRRRGAARLSTALSGLIFNKVLSLASLAMLVVPAALVGDISQKGRLGLLLLWGALLLFIVAQYFIDLRRLPRLLAWVEAVPFGAKLARLAIENRAMTGELLRSPARLGAVVGMSLLVWLVNLLQVYLLFACLDVMMPVGSFMLAVPAALLVGMLPITINGMGTRDVVLVWMLHGVADPARVAAVAMLVSARLWILCLAGLPFFRRELASGLHADAQARMKVT